MPKQTYPLLQALEQAHTDHREGSPHVPEALYILLTDQSTAYPTAHLAAVIAFLVTHGRIPKPEEVRGLLVDSEKRLRAGCTQKRAA